MKSYHFNTTVEKDGSIHLTGLPPQKEVEIIVLERAEKAEMQEWLDDIRSRHPFASMSKDEILEVLQQTREAVADTRCEHRR
jgi:hypothetical protein